MQVGHRVDAEDVGEHGDEEEVDDEADDVALEVLEEVDRPQHGGNQVDQEHDDSGADEPRKVVVPLRRPHIVNLLQVFGVEAGGGKVEDHPNDRHDCDQAEDCGCYDEAGLGSIEGQG